MAMPQSKQDETQDEATESLMLLPVPSRPIARSNSGKRRATTNLKWRHVLELHLAGRTVHEISEATGYKPYTIYGILRKDEIIALRQQLMAHVSDEFEALYPKVVKSIRDGLDSPSQDIQKEARRDWLKAHGKFRDVETKQGDTNYSAEKIIFQILNQGDNDSDKRIDT